jgi:hypothetical protein
MRTHPHRHPCPCPYRRRRHPRRQHKCVTMTTRFPVLCAERPHSAQTYSPQRRRGQRRGRIAERQRRSAGDGRQQPPANRQVLDLPMAARPQAPAQTAPTLDDTKPLIQCLRRICSPSLSQLRLVIGIPVPCVPLEDAPPELGMPRLGSAPCPHIDPPAGPLDTTTPVRFGFARRAALAAPATVAVLLGLFSTVNAHASGRRRSVQSCPCRIRGQCYMDGHEPAAGVPSPLGPARQASARGSPSRRIGCARVL